MRSMPGSATTKSEALTVMPLARVPSTRSSRHPNWRVDLSYRRAAPHTGYIRKNSADVAPHNLAAKTLVATAIAAEVSATHRHHSMQRMRSPIHSQQQPRKRWTTDVPFFEIVSNVHKRSSKLCSVGSCDYVLQCKFHGIDARKSRTWMLFNRSSSRTGSGMEFESLRTLAPELAAGLELVVVLCNILRIGSHNCCN